MNPIEQFNEEKKNSINNMRHDEDLLKKSLDWAIHSAKYKYVYNFTWLGRPIIKYPQDIVALQEIIWEIKPDLIIETGIAHGGSIIFSASMLELLGEEGEVLGIDIDIREHNRLEIINHPLYKRIKMIEGSSVDDDIFEQVKDIAKNKKKVLVLLDSLHTHEHVLQEMNLYSSLVSVGSYLIVLDTLIEYFPEGHFSDRPWDVGNNPMTAIQEFMKTNDDFIIDSELTGKLLISEGINGYLLRVKNDSEND